MTVSSFITLIKTDSLGNLFDSNETATLSGSNNSQHRIMNSNACQ